MRLDLYATRTVPIVGLAVQPATFGEKHLVKLPTGTLAVSLPDAPGNHASSERLRDDPENPDHTWISVDRLFLKADLDGHFTFNGGDEDFNSNRIFDCPNLTRACAIAEGLFDYGFDLWKRTVRWTSAFPTIGIDEIETGHSSTTGFGYKLRRREDGAVVRNHGGRVTGHALGKVSREAWKSASEAFAADETPPIWFDFLHEAFRKAVVGQNRDAVLSAAIAAETAIRAAFRSNLPQISDPTASKVLDEVPVQRLLGRWGEITGVSKVGAKRNGASEVHTLFDLRNELMHEGLRDQHQLAQIEKLIKKVALFIFTADEYIIEKAGTPRRIFPAPGVMKQITSQAD